MKRHWYQNLLICKSDYVYNIMAEWFWGSRWEKKKVAMSKVQEKSEVIYEKFCVYENNKHFVYNLQEFINNSA